MRHLTNPRRDLAQSAAALSGPALATPWSRPVQEVLRSLESSPEGLSSAQAEQRLHRFGPNRLQSRTQLTPLRLLAGQFKSPMLWILIFAAVVSLLAQEWVDAIIVLAIVLGSALLTFRQEYRASSAIQKLMARVTLRSSVVRDGSPTQVLSEGLVPGDVVLLGAGSLVPGDGLLMEASHFFVNQAVLTGESFPVEKRPGVLGATASLSERSNCVFMGTSVRSGTATVLLTHTGTATAYGNIATRLSLRPPETEFERGIRQFGYLLTQIMLVLVVLVLGANLLAHKPPIDSLLFAIALAVGIAPELLPAIVSLNLSQGAQHMAGHGVIVRRLSSIEDFGSMEVLCTDKTGTLSEGVVRLEGALDPQGEPADQVLLFAHLNAALQTGLNNALDEAIVGEAKAKGQDIAAYRKLAEIPYDFERKRLSIAVQTPEGQASLITKGALEPVLEACTHQQQGEQIFALDDIHRAQLEALFEQWSRQGYRVLGVATRALLADELNTPMHPDLEHALCFQGFLRFFDPPKPGVQQTIAELSRMGVELKILTGDNRFVAQHLAEQVGIKNQGVITGSELATMHEDALWHHAPRTSLFVELDPQQKERIILALKKTGHVVGYLGDGINDAPALYAADVGISVDSAVDVAKEAADLVLLEHDLEVLKEGIEKGRKTFANTLKYVFTTTSANFGNMISMAVASIGLPFLPLLAKQILLNNFLSDFPSMAIARDTVDPEWTQQPRRWDVAFIRRFMIVFGLISSAFDFLTFAVLLWLFRAGPELFRTAWFVESLLSELVITLIVRTRRPLFHSRPATVLWLSCLGVALVAFALPYLPFNHFLGFVALPWQVAGALTLITLLYALASEYAKRRFYAQG